ncbi:helix-turn-helix domain protein, partial [Vibrio parahaemolyticus V-223/04]
WRCCMIKF